MFTSVDGLVQTAMALRPRSYKSHSSRTNSSSVLSTVTTTIYTSYSYSQTSPPHYHTMSRAATIIPTFAAITLLLGGLNELNVQLTLVGVLAIVLHAAITPTDPYSMYPDFDNCNPTQPPLRDYVLVFGLASLVLVSLLLRIYPLVSDSVLWCLNRVLISALLALVHDARYQEGTASVSSIMRTGGTSDLYNILENPRYNLESYHLTLPNTNYSYM